MSPTHCRTRSRGSPGARLFLPTCSLPLGRPSPSRALGRRRPDRGDLVQQGHTGRPVQQSGLGRPRRSQFSVSALSFGTPPLSRQTRNGLLAFALTGCDEGLRCRHCPSVFAGAVRGSRQLPVKGSLGGRLPVAVFPAAVLPGTHTASDFLEREGKGEREGEKHRLVASWTGPDQGLNPQPRRVP